MSDVVLCRGCKKFFDYLPRGLCVECLDARDLDFKKVRDFIYASPGSTITEVADGTGVDMRIIRELIKDGELKWIPADQADQAVDASCEICGTAVSSGRHCDACRARLVGGLAPLDDDTARDHARFARKPTASSQAEDDGRYKGMQRRRT